VIEWKSGGDAMTATEILQSVQFVVDQNGKPTAALLDMRTWDAFLSLLEDVEDAELIRDRMKDWRSKKGWTRWGDFEAELETDALSGIDPGGCAGCPQASALRLQRFIRVADGT
jgi:hypothetical protein